MPSAVARCSIASSNGMPIAHAAGSGDSIGRLRGTRARKAGTIVEPSACASRIAASNARREIAWLVNGSRIRLGFAADRSGADCSGADWVFIPVPP